MNTQTAIQVAGVSKWYGAFQVLKGIDLSVHKGERIVICGPSGSGKSTLIRCMNRLEVHQEGSIVVNGIELTNQLKRIDRVRSDVGMVFQHFNLFPHLTVLEKLHGRPALGAQAAEEAGDRDCHEIPGARAHSGKGQ